MSNCRIHENFEADFEKVLFDEEELQGIVHKISEEIKQDHRGEEIVLVVILKGSFIFAADLIRKLFPVCYVRVEFMQVSSYGDGAKSSGELKLFLDIKPKAVKGKKVIVIDDVVDTALTLSKIKKRIESLGAQQVQICALLDKEEAHKIDIQIEYKGKSILNEFVTGYGLDFGQKYRNCPYVGVLKKEVYEK
ncbi:hypoxanthine phosphoribosyltransferase [bacterium]|nr:hypoxanthine phosphoribosyltransferase [bacterium]